MVTIYIVGSEPKRDYCCAHYSTAREQWKLWRVNERLTIVLLGATLDEQSLVGVAGLEPARYLYQWILSPSRLPIPPHPQMRLHVYHSINNKKVRGEKEFFIDEYRK